MIVIAYGDDERQRQASENGAAEFFTKPIDFDHLKGTGKAIAQRPT